MAIRRVVPTVLLVLAACTDPDPFAPAANTALPHVGRAPHVPVLRHPVAGYTVPQNDPRTGCPSHPTRGYGYAMVFGWNAVRGVTAYQLFAKKNTALFPIIDVMVSDTKYVTVSCNGFVIDGNLDGWSWQVRALSPSGTPGPWSEVRPFSFLPCRLESGSACFAGS
jgi:hypothetical protein